MAAKTKEQIQKEKDEAVEKALEAAMQEKLAEIETAFEKGKQEGRAEAMQEMKVKFPKEEYRAWRYHKDFPKGKIFTLNDIKGLGEGWVDHPDKV